MSEKTYTSPEKAQPANKKRGGQPGLAQAQKPCFSGVYSQAYPQMPSCKAILHR